MPRKVHLDDLNRESRAKLAKALRECIEKGNRAIEDKRWSIPNTLKDDSILPTYGFPARNPVLWMTSTRFPKKNSTRDAFLLALSLEEPISTAFEFNIGVSPSNRLNIRLQQHGSNSIIVRCKCAFAFNGAVRHPASQFFDFIRRNDVDLPVESIKAREFVPLFTLSLESMPADWPRLWVKLEKFARVVDAYKNGKAPPRFRWD